VFHGRERERERERERDLSLKALGKVLWFIVSAVLRTCLSLRLVSHAME
jgi:hypothetical protein